MAEMLLATGHREKRRNIAVGNCRGYTGHWAEGKGKKLAAGNGRDDIGH
jgi:hypothetical protein